MKKYKRADLHMHSIFSDGVYSPETLVAMSVENGAELVSLTDHDETAGLQRMRVACEKAGIDFVNGCEVSTDFAGVPIHIVALDFDLKAGSDLEALLRDTRLKREARAKKMAEQLEACGMQGVWEGVLQEVTNPKLIARPHFAAWMTKAGYVKDPSEAFRKWIGSGKPGYVAREPVEIETAVKAILQSDGIPVLAHPGRYRLEPWQFDEVLNKFTSAGGRAIEVTTGSHKPGQSAVFAQLAKEKDLWVSTGSDFHYDDSASKPALQGDLPPGLTPVWEHFRFV